MKKNMSCKGIRTNLTSPTNALRQNSKRSFNLELASCKSNAPSIIIITQKSSFLGQQSVPTNL